MDSRGCSDRLRSDGRARSAANIPLAAGGVKPVYLETRGTSIQQLGETRIGQWQAGKLVSPGQALVAQQVAGGEKGVVEIDLVSLCASQSGCAPTILPVETDSGLYPFARPILLSA